MSNCPLANYARISHNHIHTLTYMNRQELIQIELEGVKTLANSFVKEVERTLSRIRKEEVSIFLNDKDRLKLLILRSWGIRYSVSVEYILRTVLPFWEAFVQRRSKKMKSRGLNVQVSTLIGKKSEATLIQNIEKDFPNGINKVLHKQEAAERIYTKILSQDKNDGIKIKQPRISTLEKYVRHYRHSMKKDSKNRERIEVEFLKRPYRTNPFVR